VLSQEEQRDAAVNCYRILQ